LHGKRLFLTKQRLVNAPAHAEEILFQFCPQPFPCGRIRFLYKKRKTVAMLADEELAKLFNIFLKIFALARFPFLNKPSRARRIIKIENRSLNESVGGARRGGMQRISFELDRPPVHSSGNERDAAGAPRHRGRVVEKFSWDRPFHVLGKRNQMQFRATTTR
jgi:hypothetical protein